MGYGSCWFYPPPGAPKSCPQTAPPRKYMRGPAVKVGQPFLLLPYSLPKERKAKWKHRTEQEDKRKRQEKHYATSRPEDGPPACPLKISYRGPWPPLLPFHLIPLPLGTSSPSSSSSCGEIVTIYPTFVVRRKDSTDLVAPSSPESKAILGTGVLPPAEIAHVLPQFLDLGLPGRAVHEQVVAGLPLVLAASPALVGRQLVDFVAQVVSSRCVPWQELVHGSSGPRRPCARASAPFEALAPSVVCSGVFF